MGQFYFTRIGFYLREDESKHLDFFYGTFWVSIKVPHKKKTTLLFRKQQQKQHYCFVHGNYNDFGVSQHSKAKKRVLSENMMDFPNI